MDLKTFLENFDTIAQAPGGIQKLRSLILNLAVQGKLVPQNPKDESASELLQKVQLNKEKLLEQGKLHQKKPLQQIDADAILHDLPKGWVWCRFGHIIDCYRGHNPPKLEFIQEPREGYVRFIQITDFKTDESAVYVPVSNSLKYVFKGEIAMAAYRHIGKLSRNVEGAFNVAICKVIEIDPISRDYIEKLIGSVYVKGQLLEASGRAHIPSMHTDHLRSLVVPLPPLAEQTRIVEKVDELMALCDRLQQSQEARDNLRQKLRASAIDSLMNAETDEELKQSWAIVCDNWVELSQSPEDVGDLRRSVLQLAVRGKLVAQNPEDESAQELLSRIATVRKGLVQKGVKGLPTTTSSTDDALDELPFGWQSVRIGNLTQKLGAGSTPKGGKQVYINLGIKFIRSQNVWNEGLWLKDIAYISPEIHQKMNNTVVQPGDILLNITGASIGRSALVPLNFDEANVSQHVAIVRPILQEMNRWIHLYLISPVTFKNIMDVQVGISREGLSMTRLKDFLIPIPPIAEQKRIVAKVDELMQMCDRLEESLRQSQQQLEALAASAISHLTI